MQLSRRPLRNPAQTFVSNRQTTTWLRSLARCNHCAGLSQPEGPAISWLSTMTSDGLPELRRGTYPLFWSTFFLSINCFRCSTTSQGGGAPSSQPQYILSSYCFFFLFISLCLSSFFSRLGGGRWSDIDRACEVRYLRVPTYVWYREWATSTGDLWSAL